MQRIAVIAKLKPDAEKRAAELIEQGRRSIPTSSGSTVTRSTSRGTRSSSCSKAVGSTTSSTQVVRDPSNVSAFGQWEP